MKKTNASMILRQVAIAVLCSALFCLWCPPGACAGPVQWLDSYEAALKLAGRQEKPVMVFFYTTWCGYCRKLDAETYTNGAVIETAKEFICLKVNGEQRRDIAYGYGVGGYPAIFFLDPAGRVIWREFGFRDAQFLARRMQEVLAVYKKATAVSRILKSAFDEAGRGAQDRALAIIDDAIGIYRADARLYAARGAIYMNKGDIDAAVRNFDESLALNPNDYAVYNLRGMAHYRKRDMAKAMEDYNRAIVINRWAFEAYAGRGILYLEQNDPDSAIKNFNSAVFIHPRFADAYLSRGLAYTSKGLLDTAAGDLTTAIQLNPALMNAYSNRANVYLMMKQYDKSWDDVHEIERRGYSVKPEFMEELKKASGREK